jgi:RNA polymerase sigma-70 factor (ECF subfamily)
MLAYELQSREPLPREARRVASFLRVARPDAIPVVVPLVESAEPPEVLLRAVAERHDRQAFLGLFRHFAPRIKAYLRRQGTDAALADDLAQEVMLKVWSRAAAFNAAKASAATWIYTIARNTQIDAFRRARRPEVDVDDAVLVADASPLPDDAMALEQRARRVRDALANLPAEQARVVRMSFFFHKAHAEIAQELDLPLGTVKSRLRLAFGRLREALREDLP